ncbi:hypothetical protein [Bdellovibrio sp. HCB274]|uniref:hypothetical protein n=1 Tax=Bdellovibrio sp. HCB274 TaxID=3394361 RepID=UPI0039B42C07
MEIIEAACRIIFGLQMVFWGLNGFLHWVKIPPSPPNIENFVNACIETRFIMPATKIAEILLGALLIAGFAVPLTILLIAPIVFVITLLHLIHNPKPWGVVIPISLPYAIIVGFHLPAIFARYF